MVPLLVLTYPGYGTVTKAGVPNNKIFVGEASYGRSFRMAQNGCWGPMCEFTGTRLQSDANPGRCTKTPGYLSYTEIMEIITRNGNTARGFHDDASDTDVLLYKGPSHSFSSPRYPRADTGLSGDYVSYMTPTSKEDRRAAWKTCILRALLTGLSTFRGLGKKTRPFPSICPTQEKRVANGVRISQRTRMHFANLPARTAFVHRHSASAPRQAPFRLVRQRIGT
jgi:hypothetical protein